MKKLIPFFILLFAICQYPFDISAQTQTPNLGLTIPNFEPGTWGEDIANDLTILDGKFPNGQSGHGVQDEGVDLPARGKLNFKGAGVSATDNSGTGATDVTVSITGSGHTIKDEGTPLTARTGLNFTGGGVTCTDGGAGPDQTVCDIPAGSVNVASAFAWTGANSWLSNSWSLFDTATPSKILKFDISGFTASTTRTMTLPNASTRLLGDSDFSATGIMVRTGAGTFAARTLQGTTNRVTISTNPAGIGGDPVVNLGSLAVQTDQSNTFSTGDQNLAAASSFTFPSATGAAPTLEGRCAMDTTAHRLKCGFNGSTVTLAVLSEVQPLNTNLTSFAGLTGANNGVPIFTAPGILSLPILPSCADSAGQHLNYDSTSHAWSCGNSSTGGLAGATTGKFLFATSATTFDTSGNLSQTAGVVNASGGFTAGNVGTNKLSFDTSAVTGVKAWTVQNSAGLIIPCDTVAANYTDGHVIKVVKVGTIMTCADGGAAGTGTWTDGSSNTSTGNKVLRDTLAGGTNTLWTPVRGSWDGASLTADGTICADGVKSTINSGPLTYVVVCAHNTSGAFDGSLTLPITMAGNLATAKFRLTVNDVDSSSQHFSGTFKAQCRASGTAPSSTWGSTQSVDITMVTANNDYAATTAAVTPDGTCSAGSMLFWRFNITNSGSTDDDGDARVISVGMEQAS